MISTKNKIELHFNLFVNFVLLGQKTYKENAQGKEIVKYSNVASFFYNLHYGFE